MGDICVELALTVAIYRIIQIQLFLIKEVSSYLHNLRWQPKVVCPLLLGTPEHDMLQ